MPPLIYKLKRDGCAKMVEFDWDLQYAEDPVDLLSLAEKYGASMTQGINGYIEVWIDDSKQYRCQATDFVVGTFSKPYGSRNTTQVNPDSILIGLRCDVEPWIKHWWGEVNKW